MVPTHSAIYESPQGGPLLVGAIPAGEDPCEVPRWWRYNRKVHHDHPCESLVRVKSSHRQACVLECRTVVRGCSSAFHRPSPDCGSCANRTVQCSGKEPRVSPRVIAMSSRSSVFIRRCSVESGDLQLTAMPSRVSLPGIPVGSTHRSYQSVP